MDDARARWGRFSIAILAIVEDGEDRQNEGSPMQISGFKFKI